MWTWVWNWSACSGQWAHCIPLDRIHFQHFHVFGEEATCLPLRFSTTVSKLSSREDKVVEPVKLGNSKNALDSTPSNVGFLSISKPFTVLPQLGHNVTERLFLVTEERLVSVCLQVPQECWPDRPPRVRSWATGKVTNQLLCRTSVQNVSCGISDKLWKPLFASLRVGN